MVASAILFNYNTTIGAVLGVRSHVIGSAGVIAALL